MNPRILFFSLLAFACLHTNARAQSSTDPNEGSQLSQDPNTGVYTFSWWGRAGRTYFIQQSDDLLNWTYLPVIESGAEQVIQWGFTSTQPAFFLRLKYTDILTNDPFNDDFDGDGVSNWNELLQGTDPLSIDGLASSGIPDAWEQQYFGHTGVDPNALAPGGSGLTNLQEYRLGLNPLVASTMGDAFTDGWKVQHDLNPHHRMVGDTNGATLALQVFTPLEQP